VGKMILRLAYATAVVASAMILSGAALAQTAAYGPPPGSAGYDARAMSLPRAPMTEPSERYGSPAGDMAYDREIYLGSSPSAIDVRHNETVKFVGPQGREFRWRFDTLRHLDAFPLARIAPTDVVINPRATLYINGERQDGKGE